MKTPLRLAGLFLFSALILPPSTFSQGSLTPPGVPAPTFKTLQQIEPRIDLQNAPASAVTTSDPTFHYIINQPGSYYLSANITATKTAGVRINAEGVTLDLNGFEISSPAGSGWGIEIVATAHRATVRNGSIKNFSFGVRSVVSITPANGCAFRDLVVSGFTTYGIQAGEAALVESCRAHDGSGVAAIYAFGGSILNNCTVMKNTTTQGIYANRTSALNNCSVKENTGTYGIYTKESCALTNCSADDNDTDFGIFAESASTLHNCSAFRNTGGAAVSAGIGTGIASTISNCSSRNNDTSAIFSSTTGSGFNVGAGSSIQDCAAYSNRGAGICVNGESSARDNQSSGNGTGDGAGIYVTGSDNRIDSNNVTGNDRGIEVDGTGNLIIRNSASGNPPAANNLNYDIAGDNRYGPIEDITATGTAAVSGNAAASTSGTNHPWANFSY